MLEKLKTRIKNHKIKIGCGNCANFRPNAKDGKKCDVDWVNGWFMFEKVSRRWWISEENGDQYTRDQRYGGTELRVIHSWRDMRDDCDYIPKVEIIGKPIEVD